MTDTPRKRRRIKNEGIILDAARDLIVDKGLENVSLRDIARKADYSPAALYKYFDSKGAIIQAVFYRENRQLLVRMENVPSDLTAMQKIIELGLIYIEHCLKHPAYLAILNGTTTKRKSTDQPVPEHSPYLILLEAVMAWLQEDSISVQQGFGLEEISYALWAQIHGMATLRSNQLKDFDADFDSVNQKSLEFFLTGLQGKI